MDQTGHAPAALLVQRAAVPGAPAAAGVHPVVVAVALAALAREQRSVEEEGVEDGVAAAGGEGAGEVVQLELECVCFCVDVIVVVGRGIVIGGGGCFSFVLGDAFSNDVLHFEISPHEITPYDHLAKHTGNGYCH